MRLTGMWLIALHLVVSSAAGQSFDVESVEPADGASSVELETQVRFVFTDEVAVTNNWNGVLAIEPRDSADITRVSLLVDDEGVPRIVVFTVRHTPQTDFTWLVHSISSAESDFLEQPFVLRYSTRQEVGERAVTGAIAPAPPAKTASGAARENLHALAKALLSRGGNDDVLEVDASGLAGSAKTSALRNYTEIVLLGSFEFQQPEWDVVAATAIAGQEGEYRIEQVRGGVYTVAAAHYDADGRLDAIGFFDANADGAPDAINISTLDRVSIDILLYPYEAADAAAFLDRAKAAYPGADQDALVLMKDQFGADASGRAFVWSYQFYDADQNRLVSVEVDPLMEVITSSTAPGHVPGMTPISDGFIGSGEAVSIALANGGQEFLEQVVTGNALTLVWGGDQYWLLELQPRTPFWHVQIFDASDGDLFESFVDMYSGQLVSSDELPDPTASFSLEPAYPNPFEASTRIPFSLSRAASVRLEVFNVLGQRVAMLLDDQPLPSGIHRVEWNASGQPAGIYFYRIRAGESQSSRPLIVQH